MTDALALNDRMPYRSDPRSRADGNSNAVVIAESPAMKRVLALARRFAPTGVPVLLLGATGTGKELLATLIHEESGLRGPLIDINCGAFPPAMMESLLFGHRRGAFTGAVSDTAGLITAADHGTLFLDELSSLPPEGQVKLLRVLENRSVRRLGDIESRPVAFRLVAAVQDDLAQGIQAGTFRLDLFQRTAGVVLEIPPLTQREADLLPLASFFAQGLGRSLTSAVMAVLAQYSWPGNVRELRSAIERAAFLSDTIELSAAAVAEAIHLGAPEIAAGQSDVSERGRFEAVGRANGWDPALMSNAMGIGRATLFRRLKRLGLSLRKA